MTKITLPLKVWPYKERFELSKRYSNEKEVTSSAIYSNLPVRKGVFLDIGGGRGELTIPLSKQFRQTVLMDPDPDLRPYYRNYPRIKFINQGLSHNIPVSMGILPGHMI